MRFDSPNPRTMTLVCPSENFVDFSMNSGCHFMIVLDLVVINVRDYWFFPCSVVFFCYHLGTPCCRLDPSSRE